MTRVDDEGDAMGDHRASVKIEFSMHDHEDKVDFWINYSPDDDCCPYKVDRRVLEWLTKAYEKAMDNWFDQQYDAEMMRKAEIEKQEREELARLKAKYEPESLPKEDEEPE